MKAVGVKALKNNLSRYLKMVKEGTIVLVTERDEVIAEIHLPSVANITSQSAWDRLMSSGYKSGKIKLAERKKSTALEKSLKEHSPLKDVDSQAIYEKVREERVLLETK